MHLICRIGVPLPEMPCARQLNREKTRSAREPIARTKAMYLAIVMLGKTLGSKHPIYFQCRSQNDKKNREKMAEGKGFEPPKGISSFNDLANRRLQPLGHPPAGVTGLANKLLASAHVHNTRRMLPFL